LMGKLPFEGHASNIYDLVLIGQQLKIPNYINEWIHDLLCRCWQFDPTARPTFEEIMNLFVTISIGVMNIVEKIKKQIEEIERRYKR
jgi:hypothetical protein